MAGKKKLFTVLTIVFVVLIFYFLFQWLGFKGIINALQKANLAWILFSVVVASSAFFLRLGKWDYALKGCLEKEKIIRAYAISRIGGILLPARIGELSPLALKDLRKKEISAMIFVDRALEGTATLVLALIATTMLGFYQKEFLILTVFFLALLLSFFYLMFSGNRFLKNNKPPTNKLVKAIIKTKEGAMLMKKKLPLLFLFSITATLLDYSVVKVVFLALEVDVNFWLVIFAWSMFALVSLVSFVPEGLGIADSVTAGIFFIFRVAKGAIGGTILITRIIGLGTCLVLSLLLINFQTKKTKRNSLKGDKPNI